MLKRLKNKLDLYFKKKLKNLKAKIKIYLHKKPINSYYLAYYHNTNRLY